MTVWLNDRVGVPLTLSGGSGGSYDDYPVMTYVEAARLVGQRLPAYLHVVRTNSHGGGDMSSSDADALLGRIKDELVGDLILYFQIKRAKFH